MYHTRTTCSIGREKHAIYNPFYYTRVSFFKQISTTRVVSHVYIYKTTKRVVYVKKIISRANSLFFI